MSQIAYDPVKDKLAKIIRVNSFLRSLFYRTLDIFFLRSWHVRSRIRTLYADKNRPLRILDAGNGFGQYDRFLLRNLAVNHILAVDVKEDYLADCEHYFEKEIREGKISFKQADLRFFSEETIYDFILCVDVLEHIHEDVSVMRNMRAALKDGGYFLMHSPSHLAEEDAGEDEFFVDEHARAGYSSSELRSKFKQSGLKPVDIKYTYGFYGHTAWVMLIKWPMLLINKYGALAVLVLPFWYLITFLPSMLLNWADLRASNVSGTGIMGLAQKVKVNR
ncbi:MAG: class I SAM-dependent methyltransferase [Balneolales bacterium]|nr:class I SAM-dependent methyltransferase [Balneolales bacterium]